MKKIALLTAVVLLVSGAALASSRTNTGCGLGTMIFGNKADSTILQSLAVTTNGTFGNQTFGISSGTSECEQPANFVMNDRTKEFIRANMDGLARDISRGGGETVEALAELMSVEKAERSGFYSALQSNFDKIFPSSTVDYAHVADAIATVRQS